MKMAVIKGEVLHEEADRAIIFNDSMGVGFEIVTNGRSFTESPTAVYVWHVISENDQVLYGFPNRKSVLLAQAITGAQGVGPATACRLVQKGGFEAVMGAIISKDAKQLAALTKGLGAKKAKAIIALDLNFGDPTQRVPQNGLEAIYILDGLGHKLTIDQKKTISAKAYAFPDAPANQFVQEFLKEHREKGD